MRVLFLNTQDVKGGAAIVVDRLRTVLQEDFQVESRLLVGNKLSDRNDITVTRAGLIDSIEKAIHKMTNALGWQYQFFPFTARAILKEVQSFKPDIISLHNSHGGYFQTSLLERLSGFAPIVWTLHDMWSFTGNAAHTLGDISWKSLQNSGHLTGYYPSIGRNTGAWLLRQKKNIYGKSDLTIVTPSTWLMKLAQQSPVFEGKEIILINNGVDMNRFSPAQRDTYRKRLNINDQEKVVMFSSEKLGDGLWKGGNDLVEVLKIIDAGTRENLHLLMIGEGTPENLGRFTKLIPHFTGYIHDESAMAGYLAASDVFLYPTRADNLPNVLVEAIACGTPCVTFDVGGCSEIVRHGHNGYVVQPSDFPAMANRALQLLNDPKPQIMRRNVRAIAEEMFSSKEMGLRYFKLFKKRQRTS